MDPSNFIEDDFAVDLERGRRGRDHDGSVCGDDQASDQASLCGGLVSYDAGSQAELKVEGGVDVDEKKLVKENRKKASNKMAPKPPRPPRGPSLDAADQKFIREITELTMLKRIRTKRIKALKKMKAAKPASSSSNSLFATMFTIIFCCVILLQGISKRTSSHASVDGSPNSLAPEPGLISVQFVGKAYVMNSNMLVSGSPSVVEQVSGQDPHEITRSVSK